MVYACPDRSRNSIPQPKQKLSFEVLFLSRNPLGETGSRLPQIDCADLDVSIPDDFRCRFQALSRSPRQISSSSLQISISSSPFSTSLLRILSISLQISIVSGGRRICCLLMANWSELPDEIIGLFVKHLSPYLEEFARFASVCTSWKSVALEEKEKRLHFGPWLMLAKLENDHPEHPHGLRSFYSVASRRVFKFPLPQLQGTRCWGTPYGWLVTLDRALDIHLLNPFTTIQISLPSQLTFTSQHQLAYEYPTDVNRVFAVKFALSSAPSDSTHSLVVMAILGDCCELAFASPGDEAWTSLKCPPSANDDVIFYKHHFYSISNQGVLRICDLSTTDPEARDIAYPPVDADAYNFYLVEFSGNLHLIARTLTAADGDYDPDNDYHLYTLGFEVFRFNFDINKWIEAEHFDDHALFVGNNTSFAISTLSYPEFKPNCIYFTDDHSLYYPTEFCDMGVYDLKMETMTEPFYNEEDLISKFSRPVFFMPTLEP